MPLKTRNDLFISEGDPDAPLGLISWGSVAGVALEALRLARAEGLRVKLLVPKLLYPVAEEIYQDFFASVKAGLVVEQSHQGQLYRVIRMYVDVPERLEVARPQRLESDLAGQVLERLRKMALALQRTQVPESQPQE